MHILSSHVTRLLSFTLFLNHFLINLISLCSPILRHNWLCSVDACDCWLQVIKIVHITRPSGTESNHIGSILPLLHSLMGVNCILGAIRASIFIDYLHILFRALPSQVKHAGTASWYLIQNVGIILLLLTDTYYSIFFEKRVWRLGKVVFSCQVVSCAWVVLVLLTTASQVL